MAHDGAGLSGLGRVLKERDQHLLNEIIPAVSKPKGTDGPANLRVIISTKTHYLDSKGNEIPTLNDATALRHEIESLTILPLQPPDPELVGTWNLVESQGPRAVVLHRARWTFGSQREFRSVFVSGDRHPGESIGYYLNDNSEITLGEVDSATFNIYDYEVNGRTLRVRSMDESGEMGLEWTFAKE